MEAIVPQLIEAEFVHAFWFVVVCFIYIVMGIGLLMFAASEM